MGRWEPDARGRLLHAALDLFDAQGYDDTTAAQIAERAGLTRTTLFRHFADKREILFQGQPGLVSALATAVEAAPPDAGALDLVRGGVRALCEAHVPEQKAIGRRIEGLVATSPELRERAAAKRSSISAALESALTSRTGGGPTAGLLADLGTRAYYEGFATWCAERGDRRLADIADARITDYEHAVRQIANGGDRAS